MPRLGDFGDLNRGKSPKSPHRGPSASWGNRGKSGAVSKDFPISAKSWGNRGESFDFPWCPVANSSFGQGCPISRCDPALPLWAGYYPKFGGCLSAIISQKWTACDVDGFPTISAEYWGNSGQTFDAPCGTVLHSNRGYGSAEFRVISGPRGEG